MPTDVPAAMGSRQRADIAHSRRGSLLDPARRRRTSVRFNGRVFEALQAARQHRRRCDLYHAALVVELEATATRSSWRRRRTPTRHRGVVATGAVGSRLAGRLRLFRYEVRCWRGGSIPDLGDAVGGPAASAATRDRPPPARSRRARAQAGLGTRRAEGGRDVELELHDRLADRRRGTPDRPPPAAAARPRARMGRRSRGCPTQRCARVRSAHDARRRSRPAVRRS